jgi:hypothetical protein
MDPEDSIRRAQDIRRYRAESLEQRDSRAGYMWWEKLSRDQRAHWMNRAKSSIPLQCWEAYKRDSGL